LKNSSSSCCAAYPRRCACSSSITRCSAWHAAEHCGQGPDRALILIFSLFGPKPNIVKAGDYTFCAGSRSDAFFFDFDGIKNLFDIRGKWNFTEPHQSDKSPWTGVDSNTEANVFSTVVELPTSELAPKPEVYIWGRCSVRQDGKLVHVDRAGHPTRHRARFLHAGRRQRRPIGGEHDGHSKIFRSIGGDQDGG
jgi:Domain of unknown function (DUF4331)